MFLVAWVTMIQHAHRFFLLEHRLTHDVHFYPLNLYGEVLTSLRCLGNKCEFTSTRYSTNLIVIYLGSYTWYVVAIIKVTILFLALLML